MRKALLFLASIVMLAFIAFSSFTPPAQATARDLVNFCMNLSDQCDVLSFDEVQNLTYDNTVITASVTFKEGVFDDASKECLKQNDSDVSEEKDITQSLLADGGYFHYYECASQYSS